MYVCDTCGKEIKQNTYGEWQHVDGSNQHSAKLYEGEIRRRDREEDDSPSLLDTLVTAEIVSNLFDSSSSSLDFSTPDTSSSTDFGGFDGGSSGGGGADSSW